MRTISKSKHRRQSKLSQAHQKDANEHFMADTADDNMVAAGPHITAEALTKWQTPIVSTKLNEHPAWQGLLKAAA